MGLAGTVLEVLGRPAVASACVKDREIELFLACVEVDEKIEYFAENLFGARVGTVDFVDDDDRFQVELERFVKDETCLRKRSLGGIDEKQDAVRHIEHALDLTAEIAVPGGVDDIDFAVFVADADILCEDRDSAFPFDIVVVKETLVHFLIFTKNFRLFDDLVYESGLAVVYVRYDSDVSDVLHKNGLLPC